MAGAPTLTNTALAHESSPHTEQKLTNTALLSGMEEAREYSTPSRTEQKPPYKYRAEALDSPWRSPWRSSQRVLQRGGCSNAVGAPTLANTEEIHGYRTSVSVNTALEIFSVKGTPPNS